MAKYVKQEDTPSGGWLLNYLVTTTTTRVPPNPQGAPGWNGVSSALSTDGAHFADVGVGIIKDCANATDDCARWLAYAPEAPAAHPPASRT